MQKYLSLPKIALWFSGMVIGVFLFGNLAMAADGDVTSVTLLDSNNNGKIDRVDIVVEYANAGGGETDCDRITGATAGMTVTDTTLGAVTIASATWDSAPTSTTCKFYLTLTEGVNSSVNTSATADDVVYVPGNLAVSDGAAPASVAEILTGVVEVDGAAPVVVSIATNTSASQDILTVTYSEPMEFNTDASWYRTGNGAKASDADFGEMTAAGVIDGIGTWAGGTVGNMVNNAVTDNTVSLDATDKILTITLNAVTAGQGGYFTTGSTTAPTASNTFTPESDNTVLREQAAGNLGVNAAKTVLSAPTITGAWDVVKPTIASVTVNDAANNNGRLDRATVVFADASSAMKDSSIINGDASLGGQAGTFASGTANDLTTVFNLTADVTLAVDTSVTGGTTPYSFLYSGATTLIRDMAGNLLNTNVDGTIEAADIAEIDGAKPVLISAVKGTASNKDTLVLTYSEPMYIDKSNQDGNIDGSGADITSNGSMTSTASIGGISPTAGIIENIGTFGTVGTVTQNAETNNTIAVNGTGLVITITFNNTSLSHFTNSATQPSGVFTPATADYVLAQAPAATLATQRVNTSGTPASSGNWDITAPTALGSLQVVGAGATTVRLSFSPPAPPADFNRYQVYYRQGTSGTTFANGSPWTTVNDPLLGTSSTSSTLVSGLNTGFTYYFVVYSIDAAGNISTASNEVNVATSSTSGADTTAPGVPTGITASIDTNNHVALVWTDPTATDLSKIWILRGKNASPISGSAYAQVLKGVKAYTDTDVAANDTVKYQLRAEDTSGNLSTLSDIVTITVTAAAVPIVTTPTGEVVPPPVEEVTPPPATEGEGEVTAPPAAEGEGEGEGETSSGTVSEIFSDLPSTHWATEAIQNFYESGVVQGYPDGTFKPGKAANRAEALKMIILAFDFSVDTTTAVSSAPFSDVPVGQWFAPYVAFAKVAGYVAGRGTVTKLFEPAAEINRAEALALMLRMKGIDVSAYHSTGGKTFTDVKSGDWFYNVVMYAADNEIASGFAGGMFKPGQSATRAEILMMLANAL